MKKYLSLVCALLMLFTTVPAVNAKSQEFDKSAIDILVEYGYTKESAEALSEDKQAEIVSALLENPEKVDISTVTMEVDLLAEIEQLFTYSDDEWEKSGADVSLIEKNKKELLSYYAMEVPELAMLLEISEIEAEIFHRAIEKGINNKEKSYMREHKSGVMASGGIDSTEMTYTQTVRDISSDTAPEYDVTISYCWKEVFLLESYNDKIVVAWGGGLNTSYIDTLAEYYNYSVFAGGLFEDRFTSLYDDRPMDVTEKVQAGLEFSFPQSINDGNAKTRSGFACFTLYQTQYQGYDTKVVSYYCHRVYKMKDASIGIDLTGPSVAVNIGPAYHTTVQKASIISY